MGRVVSVLLSIMLVIATLASTAHAMPHGASDSREAPDAVHVVMADGAAPSCCSGDVPRAAPSCHLLIALPLADAGWAPFRTASTIAFDFGNDDGDGLQPERLLDPPRS